MKKTKEAKVLQRLIQAVCCIGGIRTPRLILCKETGGFTARASKTTIEINLSSELLAGCTPEEGALLKMGLAAHEVGHHLYTSFDAAVNAIMKSDLKVTALKDIEMMSEDWYRDNFKIVFQKMPPHDKLRAHNVIEDAYIEEALMTFLPKSPMVMALKKTRQKAFLASPTIQELQALWEPKQESPALPQYKRAKAYIALIHSYATSGRIRVADKAEYDLPIYKEIKEVFPLVDRAIEGYDTVDRLRKTMTVWTWLFARDLISMDTPAVGLSFVDNEGTEGNKKQSISRSQGQSSPSSPEEGNTQEEEQEQEEAKAEEGESTSSSYSAGQQERKSEEGEEKEIVSSSEASASESLEGKQEGHNQSDPDEEEGEEEGFDSGDESDPDEQEANESCSRTEFGSEESMSDIRQSQESEKGGVGDNGQYDEEEQEEDEDLGNKIREMLEEDVDDDEDVDDNDGSSTMIQNEEKPNEEIHKGIACIENRIGQNPSDWDRYRQIKPQIDKLVMRSYRPLEKAVKEYLTGSVRNGLYFGNRLNGKGLYRKDMRYFQDKKREEKDLNTVVSVLVDESGSMSGKKNEAAIAMSLVLSSLMEKMKVPCAVYGHHTSGCDDVTVDVYQEFGKTRSGAIMKMQASGCNRDGYALRIVGNRLLQRQEEKKVLVLVCDGQPAHTGYSGDEAYADLRAYQKELKRKGVNLIVAAIDDDKEQIKMIYGSSFMTISNLNRLAELLASRLIRITGMDQI